MAALIFSELSDKSLSYTRRTDFGFGIAECGFKNKEAGDRSLEPGVRIKN
jgi:hypothetical protein